MITTCPVCYCLVDALDRPRHLQWHDDTRTTVA